jgi:hypothetical protein
MKGIVLAIVSTLVLPLALSAQEMSLALESSATVADTGIRSVSAYEKAIPSFSLPFGTVAELAGSGYVQANYSSLGSGAPHTFIYGLEQLRFELALKKPQSSMSAFVLDVGRQDFKDPSGDILFSPADGISFSFKYPKAEVSFRAAYTGLLFLDDSLISISLADQNRAIAGTALTGSPRALVQADLAIPQLFGQALTFSFLSQDDLNPPNSLVSEGSTTFDTGKGGRLSTQYLELRAVGGLSLVNYDAFFAYSMGRTLSWLKDSSSASGQSYQYAPISSFLTGVHASIQLPLPVEGASLGLRALFASGDKDATSSIEGNSSSVYHAFVPINTPTLGLVFSPRLSNIALGEASLSATPLLGGLQVNGTLKLISFLRPSSGPISAPGLAPGSTDSYLGSEVDLALSCGILSDLGVSLSLGAFLPGTAFDASYKGLQYSGCITATVTL